MSPYCTSCGSPIPDGQGSSCSMCYGDPSYGSDGYYERWLLQGLEKQAQEKAEEDAAWERYYEEEMRKGEE